jgi:hypothetical protein
MAEGKSVEIAHELSKDKRTEKHKRRWEEVVEIVEVIFLALVAIATAWSGYQAARWDGRQALLYGNSSRDRFQADAASTLGGQRLLLDALTFNNWLQARSAGQGRLEDLFIRRFSPEYEVAFEAWLKTHPFTNEASPPGPRYMPEYHNPDFEEAARLNAAASLDFAKGTTARETADLYVRGTVLFAAVLFLVAIAQRFKLRGVRLGANAVAFALLAFAVFEVSTLRRL